MERLSREVGVSLEFKDESRWQCHIKGHGEAGGKEGIGVGPRAQSTECQADNGEPAK